jgi:hypothetical protein
VGLQYNPRGGEDGHVLRTRAVLPLKHPHKYGRKTFVVRTFNLDTTISPSSLLARAKKAAFENGATLLGDERSGRFSHDMAKGEYRMAGRTVVVTVTEKHWLLPWPVVEAQLKELVR